VSKTLAAQTKVQDAVLHLSRHHHQVGSQSQLPWPILIKGMQW